MTQLAQFCKAYHIRDLKGFSAWGERQPSLSEAGDGYAGSAPSNPDIVFLHHDFIVTTGIARDRGVLFESADPAWITYCREILKFEVPLWCQTPVAQGK